MTSCHSPWVEDRWFLPLFCSRSIQHLFIFQPRDLPGCVCWNRRRSIPRRFSTPIWSFFSFSSLVFTWQRGTFVSHDVCRWRVSLPPIHRTCRRLFPSFVPTSNATGGRVVVFRCLLGVVASAHHNVDRSYDRPIAFRFIPTVGAARRPACPSRPPGPNRPRMTVRSKYLPCWHSSCGPRCVSATSRIAPISSSSSHAPPSWIPLRMMSFFVPFLPCTPFRSVVGSDGDRRFSLSDPVPGVGVLFPVRMGHVTFPSDIGGRSFPPNPNVTKDTTKPTTKHTHACVET